jgi:hypothetical protein
METQEAKCNIEYELAKNALETPRKENDSQRKVFCP